MRTTLILSALIALLLNGCNTAETPVVEAFMVPQDEWQEHNRPLFFAVEDGGEETQQLEEKFRAYRSQLHPQGGKDWERLIGADRYAIIVDQSRFSPEQFEPRLWEALRSQWLSEYEDLASAPVYAPAEHEVKDLIRMIRRRREDFIDKVWNYEAEDGSYQSSVHDSFTELTAYIDSQAPQLSMFEQRLIRARALVATEDVRIDNPTTNVVVFAKTGVSVTIGSNLHECKLFVIPDTPMLDEAFKEREGGVAVEIDDLRLFAFAAL